MSVAPNLTVKTNITTSYDAESNVKTLSFLNQTVNCSRDALGLATNIDNTTFT